MIPILKSVFGCEQFASFENYSMTYLFSIFKFYSFTFERKYYLDFKMSFEIILIYQTPFKLFEFYTKLCY